MHFVITTIHNTVLAYSVSLDGKPLGQVFLRDEYWHARPAGRDALLSGGVGFVHGRGYEHRNKAATALAAQLAPARGV